MKLYMKRLKAHLIKKKIQYIKSFFIAIMLLLIAYVYFSIGYVKLMVIVIVWLYVSNIAVDYLCDKIINYNGNDDV